MQKGDSKVVDVFTDYQILEFSKVEELIAAVELAMRNGWQPQGGIALTAIGNDCYVYTQAMVKTHGLL